MPLDKKSEDRQSECSCGYSSAYTSERFIKITCLGIVSLASVFLVVNFISRGEYFISYFSSDWSDTFMDYFNMLENVRLGDPYYAEANYPAINFVILKLLFHFVPQDTLVAASSPREEAMDLRALTPAMLPFIILLLVCLIVIILCIRKLLANRDISTQNWVTVAVLLSGPMIFLLERGNLLLIALSFLMLFFAYWRSDIAWQRILAVVALSIASALKLYPAAFALLLIADKRWKDFALTVIFGLIFLIAPFFAFGGVSAIQSFIGGIGSSSNTFYGLGGNYSLSNIIGIIHGFLGVNISGAGGAAISIFGIIIPLIAFILSRETWAKVLSIAMMTLWVPSFSYTYSLTLLLPAFTLFLDSSEALRAKRRTFVAICFIVVLSPLVSSPVASILALDPGVKFVLYWGCVIQNIALIVLLVSLIVSGMARRINLVLRRIYREGNDIEI